MNLFVLLTRSMAIGKVPFSQTGRKGWGMRGQRFVSQLGVVTDQNVAEIADQCCVFCASCRNDRVFESC